MYKLLCMISFSKTFVFVFIFIIIYLKFILGQHNDARMNLSLVITAARMGANVANHVAVTSLIKTEGTDGKVCGARVKDLLTGWLLTW